MPREWTSRAELAQALMQRGEAGREVRLSPQTAILLAQMLMPRATPPAHIDPPRRPDPWTIDLHKEGSCVYRLDGAGGIDRIDAWARSTAIGRLALAGLKDAYPKERFEQRRRSWVEGR